MIYKLKPTTRQKQAVDNILSGKFKSIAEAMREAGYSLKSSLNPKYVLAERKAVKRYVRTLSIELQGKWNMSVSDKIVDVYLDGLDAVKPDRLPDHLVRLRFADRISEFLGWIETSKLSKHKNYKL